MKTKDIITIMAKTRCSLIIVPVLLSCISANLGAVSWPLYRGTSERTGTVSEYVRPTLVPRWRYQLQGEIVSSPSVYKGILYCGARDMSINAFDAYTGESLWNYSASGWVDASPCVSSAAVYVPSVDKNLYAFDRITGDPLWQTSTGSQDSSSPLLYEGRLYYLSGFPEKKIYGVNARTGAMETAWTVSQFGFSSPALYDGRLYFGTNDGRFTCLDIATGQTSWSRATQGSIYYSCVAVDGTGVFAASGGDERKLFRLSPVDGSVQWSSVEIDTQTSAVSSVTLSEDAVYLVSTFMVGEWPDVSESRLRLLAFPKTGTTPVSPLWSCDLGQAHPSGIVSSPAVAGGTIYVGSGNGFLYSIDALTGKYIAPATGALSDTATGYFLCFEENASTGVISSPSVSNGWVYAATNDGYIWGFEAQRATALTAPDNNDVVIDSVSIQGTILDTAELPFVIDYGTGSEPAAWTTVATGSATVVRDTITAWNTTSLPDGDYTLRLTADNNTARRSLSRFTVDNRPGAPASLSAAGNVSASGNRIALSWTRSTDDGAGNNDVAGYTVYRATDASCLVAYSTAAAASISFIDTAATTGVTYYYTLSAYDRYSYSGFSNIASTYSFINAAANTAPAAPVLLTAVDTPDDGGGSITLGWGLSADDGAGANDVIGYRLYKGTAPESMAALVEIPKGTTYYADIACPAYTTYYYCLTAFDALLESERTSTAAAFSEMNGVEITPELGGTVQLVYNGLITEVVIEPGTLSQKARIAIKIPSYSDTGIPASANPTSIVREFTVFPADTAFLKPVTIKIPYAAAETSAMTRENLRIYWYDPARAAWRIVNTSDPSSENGRVWARIPHFSQYRVMEYVPGREEILDRNSVYATPNPAKGDKLTFKFYAGDRANVTVDVYSIAGDLIAHLERADCPAGIVSGIDWSIGGTASGTYVYVIEAKGAGGGAKTIKKKLAIIH